MQVRAEERERQTYIHGRYLAKLTGLLQRQKNIHFTFLSDCYPTEDLLWKLIWNTQSKRHWELSNLLEVSQSSQLTIALRF